MARSWLFGINCYIAAIAALFIAFVFDLPNPFWALVTVFLTSQPGHAGGVWAKGRYRIFGTLIGLAAALVLVPNLVDEPEILIAALALWLGVCLFFSMLDRTSRSYMVMLAGYTAVLVGLPVIDDPTDIFNLAVARAEEILIGVCCATVVQAVIFPLHLHDVLLQKVDACLADAAHWTRSALDGGVEDGHERLRYATSITELAVLASTFAHEPPRGRSRVGVAHALAERLGMVLPILDAIDERLRLLRTTGPLSAPVREASQATRDWVERQPADRPLYVRAVGTCRAGIDAMAPAGWRTLEEVGVLARLESLATAFLDCRLLADALRHPEDDVAPEVSSIVARARPFSLHSDPLVAAWSGLAAAIAVMATGYLCILIQWTPGTTAIGIAAVFSALFSTVDDPTPVLRKSLVWTVAAIPVSFVYAFGILPAIDGFFQLAFVMLPLIVLMGYWISKPNTMIQGVILAVMTTAMMGLRPKYDSDFESFFNVSIACALGMLSALATIQSVRVIGSATVASRVVRDGWLDLAWLASAGKTRHAQYAMRMLDRVGLLLTRSTPTSTAASSGLRDLRLGINLSELMSANDAFPPDARQKFSNLRRNLARAIRARVRGTAPVDDPALDEALSTLRGAVINLADAGQRVRAITALTGLRNGLVLVPPSFGPRS